MKVPKTATQVAPTIKFIKQASLMKEEKRTPPMHITLSHRFKTITTTMMMMIMLGDPIMHGGMITVTLLAAS